MGAHPRGPSRLVRAGGRRALGDVIAADPSHELGAASVAEFGPRLPFLMKVLAAGEPLSLQAHPSAEQARTGFDNEERLQIPVDAPHRNYKDPNHKPELICALTPFDALCGFRSVAETLALFDALGVSELDATLAPLQWSDRAAGLSATLHAIMTKPEPACSEMVAAVAAACEEHDGPFAAECAWAVRLERLYPGDPGIVTSLLLNLVHLEPGEAIYLGAGNLHAYLGGAGVEIMASSDNVLRGGLTPKHVDLDELLRVLDFADGPVEVIEPRSIDPDEDVWDTPAREFRLSRLSVNRRRVSRVVTGPEILLCAEGAVLISDPSGMVSLSRGGSAFVPASCEEYTLTGQGQVFRASVPV
jgi:mannose-6-phosphate isomerase